MTLAALVALLFMQLALAAHACAVVRQAAGPAAGLQTAAGGMSMPDCDEEPAAVASTALCQAHCQDAQASPEASQSPAVEPVPVRLAMPLPRPPSPAADPPDPSAPAASFLQRTTAPPLSIRHCCLRL